MINKFHAKLHRPERGWDPVPRSHSVDYAENEWRSGANNKLLDTLESWMGGFEGKRVLDLGGGPGQYSVAFAKRGAITTWYDVSRIYHDFSKQKADENGVGINFSIGYLDEAPEILNEQFDLVFNRICWNYGFCDFSFALKLYSLVSPGGVGYIDTTHSGWKRDTLPRGILFRTWLNDTTGVKIGHPHPPHGRLAKIFSQFPIEEISIDYKMETNDRITFRRKLER